MSRIEIVDKGITELGTEAVVNAANEGLTRGSGVCGAIFAAAGEAELTMACRAAGHCDTGKAIMTPAFRLDADCIIHAVGPSWHGGRYGERKLLYSAYSSSLELASAHGCHSIGFPLISTGVFEYPTEEAWRAALSACRDFLKKNAGYDLLIRFGVPDYYKRRIGMKVLKELDCPGEPYHKES